ncbi:MAG: DUF2569 domain-containing protein [Devosia sp.]
METLEQLREQDRLAAAGPGPVGLGGWLFLPTLGMVLTPILAVAGLGDFLPALAPDAGLTAAQTLLVWFELLGNGAIQIVAPFVLLTLMFQKRRTFPSLFVGWTITNLVFVLVDLVFAYNVFRAYYDSPGVVFWDEATGQSVSRAVIYAAIWVPYMLNARRVKNTFVN